jgi:hypothetical protein
VDGFISGMTASGPYLSLRGMPRLSATNTLYVVAFRGVTALEQRAGWGLALLTSRVRENLHSIARVYPDGLLKFEPGELGTLQLPVPQRRKGAISTFKRATQLMAAGDAAQAIALADAFFQQPGTKVASSSNQNGLRVLRV